jgi:hypothetical protein
MEIKNQNANKENQVVEQDDMLGLIKSKIYLVTKNALVYSVVTIMSFIESILFLLVSHIFIIEHFNLLFTNIHTIFKDVQL